MRLELGQLTVVTGASGTGKSSLYRALCLLADVAQGRILQSLAREGRLSSVLWAGSVLQRANCFAERRGLSVVLRDKKG